MAEGPALARGSTAPVPRPGGRDLWLRVASSVVLAPLAVLAAYLGGAWFIGFWLIAAAGILWEWMGLVAAARALSGPVRAGWIMLGACYAGAMLAAPLVIRADARLGFVAMIFLFAVVWATDVAAYFAGRLVGGPKLWPAISPKKTWSGAVGGSAAGTAAGLAVAVVGGIEPIAPLLAVGFLLSVIAQFGDLFESSLKRRFGVKDASHVIPGHGGVMDRLDGLLAAALAAALIGLARGGLDGAATGFLLW
ncbi:MAG TPA: phosphatidate cytidylyltransferase [Xanthobacteraceae bacterium]|nr:phosphatidate cytidylyltransferase [Xanthobacteraceae bacterium]